MTLRNLSVDERDRILGELGLSEVPSRDLMGLESLYCAWLDRVPFCSSLKRIHYGNEPTRSGPLPVMDPREFFSNFLQHGTGGTCFPTAEAFYALCRSCDFPVRRSIGSMVDFPEIPGPNHGTVVADFEGSTYLVDPFWGSRKALSLNDVPQSVGPEHLALSTAKGGEEETLDVLWRFHTARNEMRFAFSPNHSFHTDSVGFSLFRERYEASSGPNSVFNACLYISRHVKNDVHTIFRGTYYVLRDDNTIESESVEDRNSLLTGVFGLSEQLALQIPPDINA
ncbi:MAG: arylamine N-acetyltransferase [Pseudomonadales bacterium]